MSLIYTFFLPWPYSPQ